MTDLLQSDYELDQLGSKLALVTLNRPDDMNPLDWETVLELEAVFDRLADDPSVRVVAVTGAGRAFSAGGDLKAYRELQRHHTDFPAFLRDLHRTFGKIADYPKPYIALVNGTTLAGGIELMLSCDFAIAGQSARIGDGHLNFGQMGGGGVLTLLAKMVGPARARELIFTGRLLDADEAMSWGLVSQVVDDDQLLTTAINVAIGISTKSPLALSNAKSVIHATWGGGASLVTAFQLEQDATARYCLTSHDAAEGLEAFADKRAPRFTGR